ncbi:unnamed protein product [Schistosoma rodhaini]|nr:unnamed protein product [Schistosoma rodhaini]
MVVVVMGELIENFEVENNYLSELPFSESQFIDFEVINKELNETNQLFDYFIKNDEMPYTIQNEQIKTKEDLKIIKGKNYIKLLDMILNSKLKQEKEIKENTRILHKQIEDELNNLINSNKKLNRKFKTFKQINQTENKKQNSNQIVPVDTYDNFTALSDEICRNIEKFLQLNDNSLSQNNKMVMNKNNNDSCQNNVETSDLEEETTSESIFKTEYIKECETNEEKEKEDRINKLLDQEIEVDSNTSLQNNQCNQFKNQNASFNSFNGKSMQNKKNFIKRNMELASRWKDVIPMTNEEKERLEEILAEEEETMQVIEQNNMLLNELNTAIHNESSDSLHNERFLSIDSIRSKLWLCLNRTKRNGSCSDMAVSNNDDDQNPSNNQPNSVNQIILKGNCQQLDNQMLGMLYRLNEIDEQLEKFQIQRKIDSENVSEILSSLRSTERRRKQDPERTNTPKRMCTQYIPRKSRIKRTPQ